MSAVDELLNRAAARTGDAFLAAGQEMTDAAMAGKLTTDLQAVTVHTGIPVKSLTTYMQRTTLTYRGADPASREGVLIGCVLQALFMGWVIRDEQERTGKDFEGPAVCDAGQTALRASGHKFCPDCGILRVLHRELTDGDD